MTDFWNGCKRAVYLVLFAILIPVSAYAFYGAVDTLNNAAVTPGNPALEKWFPLFRWEPLFCFACCIWNCSGSQNHGSRSTGGGQSHCW